jgi:hypothetical protein
MTIVIMALPAIGIAGIVCWRIAVGIVAARPVGDRLRYAMGSATQLPPAFSGSDFALLERIFAAAGALGRTGRGASVVSAYYQAVHGLGVLLPFLSGWSEHEMNVCARYLAARTERLLASNAACSRHLQSL